MENQYIFSIRLKKEKIKSFAAYPFSLPLVRYSDELKLHKKITFFVGENGSGKSTLLEAIAVNFGLNAEGGSRNFSFSTYASHSVLSDYLLLTKGFLRPKDTYFLRAESFYNVASYIEELDRIVAAAPPIKEAYGGNLHLRSHGESFFALLCNRLRGEGLYLFDEPEAALSPKRQLMMLNRIHELIQQGSQFVIATHSPILTAYPDCTIYSFSDRGPEEVGYEQTENYREMKRIMEDYRLLQSRYRD